MKESLCHIGDTNRVIALLWLLTQLMAVWEPWRVVYKQDFTRSVLQLQYCDDFVAIHFAIFHKAEGAV